MTSDSRLEKILEEGKFAVTSECGPPRGADAEVISKKGELIKSAVDAVNVTDNQTSVTRLCSLAACVHLKQLGLDPVLQMVVRDRNRIALQSDILGAASFGVNNVLCLSGDLIGSEAVRKIVETWLTTEFVAGRHLRRVKKIEAIERGDDPREITTSQ